VHPPLLVPPLLLVLVPLVPPLLVPVLPLEPVLVVEPLLVAAPLVPASFVDPEDAPLEEPEDDPDPLPDDDEVEVEDDDVPLLDPAPLPPSVVLGRLSLPTHAAPRAAGMGAVASRSHWKLNARFIRRIVPPTPNCNCRPTRVLGQ
jgi:hypothetical protein